LKVDVARGVDDVDAVLAGGSAVHPFKKRGVAAT